MPLNAFAFRWAALLYKTDHAHNEAVFQSLVYGAYHTMQTQLKMLVTLYSTLLCWHAENNSLWTVAYKRLLLCSEERQTLSSLHRLLNIRSCIYVIQKNWKIATEVQSSWSLTCLKPPYSTMSICINSFTLYRKCYNVQRYICKLEMHK